jgi:hypothetical protein
MLLLMLLLQLRISQFIGVTIRLTTTTQRMLRKNAEEYSISIEQKGYKVKFGFGLNVEWRRFEKGHVWVVVIPQVKTVRPDERQVQSRD